ncbi:MAG TPA: hypothetical protein VJ719_16050 [Chthoniobacterales bacterium]|nr:hypothetical protein [Chthoniobacterales bacterium]
MRAATLVTIPSVSAAVVDGELRFDRHRRRGKSCFPARMPNEIAGI